MPGPADVLGPILELMTWVGFVPGIPLLATGWILARRRCPWTSTTAEVFDAGRYKGLRWFDSANTLHLSLHALSANSRLEEGAHVELHYDQCHPARWSIGEPRHENPVLIIGWIMTAVGIVCTVAGFVLLMF